MSQGQNVNDLKSCLLLQLRKQHKQLQEQLEQLKQQEKQDYRALKQCLAQTHQQQQECRAKIQQEITNMKDALTSEDPDNQKHLLSIDLLGKYLNEEKKKLKEIIGESDTHPENLKPTDKVHQMVNRLKYEQHLQQLREFQLQQEIKYLKDNILVGKSVLYDVPKVPPGRMQELNRNLSNCLEELERNIMLNPVCPIGDSQKLNARKKMLKKQHDRLQQVDQLLEKERKTVERICNMPKALNQVKIEKYYRQQPEKPKEEQLQYRKPIDFEQVDDILNFELKQLPPTRFQKPYEEIEAQIMLFKKQIRKLELKK